MQGGVREADFVNVKCILGIRAIKNLDGEGPTSELRHPCRLVFVRQ